VMMPTDSGQRITALLERSPASMSTFFGGMLGPIVPFRDGL
jgi:hypothetical protein